MKRSAVALVVAALCLAGVPGQVASARAPIERGTASAPAGLAGTPIELASQSSLHGYDIAMDVNGTAYVGWISATGGGDRTVHSCVLPQNATGCLGGIKSAASLGASSAAGLQVLPPFGGGNAILVWFHDTPDSGSLPLGGRIAYATLQANGTLSGALDTAVPAYSFGSLETAERAPDGNIWLVQKESAGAGDGLRVVAGLDGSVSTLNPPWLVGKARLAFAGSKAVLVFEQYGPITEKLRVIRQTDTGWSAISAIDGTWNLGGAFDVAAQGGVKLVAAINNANYYPRIASWTGTAFGPFTLTGDKNNCAPTSHDLFPDPSGRLADVSFECNQITIANQPKAKTGAFTRFSAGGTPAGGDPQIATYARGLGWVAWGRQDTVGQRLVVAPIRLPAQRTTRSTSSSAGKVTVTGPVSCLPAVQTTIGVSAKPASGWSVVSKTLKLDGALHGTALNGALLDPGSNHTITGTVKFKNGGQTRTVTAQLSFAACVTI